MIYALDQLNQKLIKAEPHIKGICPDCKQEMVAKCGVFVIHHWSHKSLGDCDSHWEPTSQWHLEWQNSITDPIGGINIEVPIVKTERYKRADMVAHTGMIIEFQKSPMSLKERLLRETHYGNMMWLIHFEISSSKTWKYNSPSSYLFVHDLDGNIMYLKNYTFQFKITPSHFIKTFINSNFSPGELEFDVIKARYNKILWNAQSIKHLTQLLFILLGEWEEKLEQYWYCERINRTAKYESELRDITRKRLEEEKFERKEKSHEECRESNINPNKIDVWDYKPSVEENPLVELPQKKVIKEIPYSEWFSLLSEGLLVKGYVEVKL